MDAVNVENEQLKQTPTEASKGFLTNSAKKILNFFGRDDTFLASQILTTTALGFSAGSFLATGRNELALGAGVLSALSGYTSIFKGRKMANENKSLKQEASSLKSIQEGNK